MKKKKILKKTPKKSELKKEENPIYVQLNCEEFNNSKRDILSYQINLINMLKTIKKYSMLRESEFNIKLNLQNKFKETKENLNKLDTNLPKVDKPKPKKESSKEEQPSIEYYNQDLESQLEQIRKKLEEIGK
jgi:hypothetical protein